MRLPSMLLLVALAVPWAPPAFGQNLPDSLVADSTFTALELLTGRFDPAPGCSLCGNYALVQKEPDSDRSFLVVFLDKLRGASEFQFPTKVEIGNLRVWPDIHNRVPRARVRYSGTGVTLELWAPYKEVKGCRWLEMRVTTHLP